MGRPRQAKAGLRPRARALEGLLGDKFFFLREAEGPWLFSPITSKRAREGEAGEV